MGDKNYLTALIQRSVGGCSSYWASMIAYNLIAHGVTIPQWHDAETDPPKEPNEYIVMIKGGASATALLYDEEEWFEMQGDERIGYHVTHWMPLPEPPKKEK